MQDWTTQPVKFLQGENVYLRPVQPSDAPFYYASQSNEELRRLTGMKGHFTMQGLESYISRIAGDNTRADFIFCSQETDAPLGDVVLNSIDHGNRSCNMRVATFREEECGKGYGTEAIRLMLGYGFGTLNLHRIDLEVYAFNERAIRSYEKIGFKREGVKRDALYYNHQYVDAIVMSMLEDEYRELYVK